MYKSHKAEMSQADMDRVIEEYMASTDESLVDFVQSIRSGNTKNADARNFSIGAVSDRTAANPSPMIRYEKRVNGTYYVVEAVPDSKAKVLRVISAYKENVESGDGHVLNMATKAPQLTSEQLGSLRSTPPHATSPTDNKIPNSAPKVNKNLKNLSKPS